MYKDIQSRKYIKITTLRQSLIKIIFVLFSSILILFFAMGQIWNNIWYSQFGSSVLANESQNREEKLPVRLIIPTINVDTYVEYVGIKSNGEMDVPSSVTNVGWFSSGTVPGAVGSAVIDGHIDGKSGEPGVFFDLDKLKVGDRLFIEDNKGELITFVVRENRIYSPGYAEEIFTLDDAAHLNLITCYGSWDKANKSYSKRLVVFTDLGT